MTLLLNLIQCLDKKGFEHMSNSGIQLYKISILRIFTTFAFVIKTSNTFETVPPQAVNLQEEHILDQYVKYCNENDFNID